LTKHRVCNSATFSKQAKKRTKGSTETFAKRKKKKKEVSFTFPAQLHLHANTLAKMSLPFVLSMMLVQKKRVSVGVIICGAHPLIALAQLVWTKLAFHIFIIPAGWCYSTLHDVFILYSLFFYFGIINCPQPYFMFTFGICRSNVCSGVQVLIIHNYKFLDFVRSEHAILKK
jgi:hypothetical protein